jgi:hypothetical protein
MNTVRINSELSLLRVAGLLESCWFSRNQASAF